ncbi:hypothetical protein ACFQ9Z_38310 [Streptomyces sp. NPDC056580]|uniref:hypothetical protein n=1 Tax=Streptomyces sp. NPDC056580 TaxID=3345872 RepID=UPI0036C26789
MTETLGAGIALISITGREFSQVDAVEETLTDVFAYAGPLRDQIAEEGICRSLVLRISGLTDDRAARSALPVVPFDISDVGPSQARVRVIAAAPEDLRAVTAVISAGHSLVGEPAQDKGGSAVPVVSVR